MQYRVAALRQRVEDVRAGDPEIAHEIDEVLRKKVRPDWLGKASRSLMSLSWDEAPSALEAASDVVSGYQDYELESIVLRVRQAGAFHHWRTG